MTTASRKQEHDSEQEMMMPMSPEIFDRDGPIWVNQFTEDSARAFVKQLQYQSGRNPGAPIVINIDSGGGQVYALFTMIAAMESIPNQIITIAYGKAMSAGAALLAHGDIRYASPHSTLMLHEVSAGTVGNIADMVIQHDHIERLNEKLLNMLADKCKVKGGAAGLKKVFEKTRDLFMSPEEAVAFGLVDKIGVPSLQRKVQVEWSLASPQRPSGDKNAEPEAKPAKSPKSAKSKPAKATKA